ncbi:MAG: flagellar export chaperone FliS [Candidatus Korobacteraceae bacterium]
MVKSHMKIPNAALAYRETASLGASPVGVVVLLYDRLAQDIHAAVAASKTNQVEARTAVLNHALLILQQLQGRLDFVAGGAAARQLDAFYSHVRAKLLEAQIRQSPELLLAQAQAIAQVRESWAEVERNASQAAATVPPGGLDNLSAERPPLNLGA